MYYFYLFIIIIIKPDTPEKKQKQIWNQEVHREASYCISE